MRAYKFTLICLLSTLLTACQGFNPSTDTMGVVFSSALNSNTATYLPGFEYIEVEFDGKKTALALGYRTFNGQDVEEYWYSGTGEMIALRNGRISQVMGMTNEVRQTSREIPSWSQLQANHLPLTWMRVRDLQPRYRYGVIEYVTSEVRQNKRSEDEQTQTWVYERVSSKAADGSEWRYQDRFRLNNGLVVSSEQCIAPQMCFKLKPLGVMVRK